MHMQTKNYPVDVKVSLEWGDLFRKKENPALSERASSRMVRIAAHLPEGEFVGFQMDIPQKGLSRFSNFGTAAVQASDLKWISEEAAKAKKEKTGSKKEDTSLNEKKNWNLYEIRIPIEQIGKKTRIGFGIADADGMDAASEAIAPASLWPRYFPKEFGELVSVLRSEGAVVRYAVGRANNEEQQKCKETVLSTWRYGQLDANDYIGYPVRVKIMLLIPSRPSVRLKAVLNEYAPGAEISLIGNMLDKASQNAWANPMLRPQILPDYAARIMAMEPQVGEMPILGVTSCDEEAKPLPTGHHDPVGRESLLIGKALSTSGLERDIRIADTDLRRHWQIIGQTGTGKSTLIAGTLLNAIKSGKGVTFFDPHGTTIDAILLSVPKNEAGRIRVVRLGDAENPIPINIWNTDDYKEAERIIADLNLLFSEIFDPKNNGYVGPRWERWFSLFASANIAFLGKRASFDSIALLSQNRETMIKLAKAIRPRAPRLSESIESEFVDNRSNDFAELVSWCVCKMQRLTSIPQLRNTLGAGADALDFENVVDGNTVTLVDLALPTIGTHASRILGTMIMLKLWNAILSRKCREKTHIVAIDEAHLFQTNPLPQMFAEGRKFGLSVIFAHQHCGQLNSEIKDSLEANSANFSAFCLSRKDAIEAVNRIGNPELFADLSRQNAFSAITTLSIGGKQTPAFTLQVQKPKTRRDGKTISSEIEERSRQTLVEPYRMERALSGDEVLSFLDDEAAKPKLTPPGKRRQENKQTPYPGKGDYLKRLSDIATWKEDGSVA